MTVQLLKATQWHY